MKKTKEIDTIINDLIKKYGNREHAYINLAEKWYYKDGIAFWTDGRTAIKISGFDKSIEGISNTLSLKDVSVRKKTDYDKECPNYEKLFDGVTNGKKTDIVDMPDDLPLKDRFIQVENGWAMYYSVYTSQFGKDIKMYIPTTNDLETKYSIRAWHNYLVFMLSNRCVNGTLYQGQNTLYYQCEYADKIIEVIFTLAAFKDNNTYPEETEKNEEEMQEEVERERERNEEPAESLNDRHEEAKQEEIQEEEQEEEKEEEKDTQEQEELNDVEELEDEKYDCNDEKVSEIDKDEPLEEEKEENNIDNISEVKQELTDDMTIYDIVFEYLIKNSCIPTSNGSGGLNIDCPYQKKDIVKSLGAMWSPRYYRWYLRADRLERAANIIKAM